jgi:NACHT N-terminal Helical domain 7
MRKEPALTYQGALQILGHRDQRWLKRIDLLLGGGILVAGAASLVNPLASVAAFAAIWAWIDQKNEAVRLVREALDGLPARLRDTAGLERRQLVIAAHSTLVVAAYFEVLRDKLGAKRYDLLELTNEDKARLAAPQVDFLYRSEVPAPSARAGFVETQSRVVAWLMVLDARVERFVGGLAAGELPPQLTGFGAVTRTVERYASHYTRLAATVPEFRVWAELDEHAATRNEVRDLGDDLRAALEGQTEALTRLENLLTLTSSGAQPSGDVRAAVWRANQATLDEPIIPTSSARQYGRHLAFPLVGRVFVNPRYRIGVSMQDTRPADETWWGERDIHDDLDLRLTAHLTSAEATRCPLLVLGHPGAGKSLLTKVFAARLPPASYTVVRVSLRHVSAHLPIYEQVQQALDRITHQRVPWADLVEQSLDTVRVVVLDGLDELVQQEHTSLYGYLHNVMEFQRMEASQDRPVVVVVTSRTVVSDRVDIPDGTAIVKLEDFDDRQIGGWLDTWHEVNAAGIAAGIVRRFPLEVALGQRDLTRQPLLLMMMALYVADPTVPALTDKLSSAELYRRLLHHFCQREAAKSPTALTPEQVEEFVDDQLRRLSTAALGMFNRGRQDITADELGADLAALGRQPVTPELGRRVLGEFFFVYAAEAQFESLERRYEFLHATFGEYLVASRLIEELAEVTHAAFSARGRLRELDDDLLFALLSHEALAVRRPTLTFATELCAGIDQSKRDRMLTVLDTLIADHRNRHGTDIYQDYRPRSVDRVRELSAYSANLVLLRVALHDGDGLLLHELFRDGGPFVPWRSMLALWQAGLDGESWRAMLSVLGYYNGRLSLTQEYAAAGSEAGHHAKLAGDEHAERVIRFGEALVDGHLYANPGDAWSDTVEPWLALALSNRSSGQVMSLVLREVTGVDREQIDSVLDKLEMLLKVRAHETAVEQAEDFVRFILDNRKDVPPDPYALAAAVLAHPSLLRSITELKNPRLFDAPGVPLMLCAEVLDEEFLDQDHVVDLWHAIEQRRPNPDGLSPEICAAVRELIISHRWQMPPVVIHLDHEPGS